MKLTSIILLLGICFPALVLGQGETTNWYFGNGAGIRFNTDGSVTALTQSRLSTFEGCATISNALGDLLFYTDGITVFDRTHAVMQNGQALYGDSSSTQSALIVPKPEDPNIFYIFTVDTSISEDDVDKGLNYSVVDMTLNNGDGALIEKNKNLLFKCSEKITAVVKDCSDKSIWVITLASSTGFSETFDTYHAFEINTSGVVQSSIKTTFGDLQIEDGRGYLKLSSNGKKIASANALDGLYVYDFDAATGKLSNQEQITINTPNKFPYGIEFSPSSQFLYVNASNDLQGTIGHSASLLQYDLFSTDISASQEIIDNRAIYRGALQLGDNGRIYRTTATSYLNGSSTLGVLNNPNKKGSGADYQHNAISLQGKFATQGLPPFIQSFFNKVELIQNQNGTTSSSLAVCSGESLLLQAENILGATYQWQKDGVLINNMGNILQIASAEGSDSGRYRLDITMPNPSDCPIIGEAIIFIDPVPQGGNRTLTQCDLDIDTPTDGITVFNLEQTGQDLNNTYTFYENTQDRDNDIPIENPISYINTQAFNQFIFYKVSNSLGCKASGQLMLQVQSTVVAANPQVTFFGCDNDPRDALLEGSFNLSDIAQIKYPNHEVAFYAVLEDVVVEQNALPNNYTTEATTIYARLERANQCQEVLKIELKINPSPLFTLAETYLICTDNPALIISGPEGYDSYQWLKIEADSEQLISNDKNAAILEIGDYALAAGYSYTNNGETIICDNRVHFKVLPSNKAIINAVLIEDLSKNNRVQIEVSGDGDYEFSLDGSSYQESNLFKDVPSGFITIYVNDKNGCGISDKLISVVGYPKFFTPNGDGFNDEWKLVGVNQQFQKNSQIAIFDRFGKQVAQINSGNNSWNGTYNSQLLPASDYWFTAILEDGRVFNGHFALKR
ncbi:MAG: T9SS type B sorting domain-containing protein [Flavobacteriaceae bacterium]